MVLVAAMKALILYAHPERKISLHAALRPLGIRAQCRDAYSSKRLMK